MAPQAGIGARQDADSSILSGAIVQALTTVGTGIGLLGFVIFCGGAVLYIRLEAAGLPAVEGVARVPREVLIATGAELLVPAALVTVGVVMALYVADLLLTGEDSKRMRPPMQSMLAAEAEQRRLYAAVQDRERQAQIARETALQDGEADSFRAAQLEMEAVAAARVCAEKQDVVVHRAHVELERARRRERSSRTSYGWFALFLVEVALATVAFDSLPTGQVMILLIGAAVTSLLAFAVFSATQRFGWFGVAAFLSIGMVFALARFYETKNDPHVAPAAVLRTDRQPTAGFLVADTGSLLLLGQSGGGETAREMIVMPRDEIEDLVLGRPTNPEHARIESLKLLAGLCAQHTADGYQATADHPAAPRRPLCTASEREQVRRDLTAAMSDEPSA